MLCVNIHVCMYVCMYSFVSASDITGSYYNIIIVKLWAPQKTTNMLAVPMDLFGYNLLHDIPV